MPRLAPRTISGIILALLAALLSIPIVDYALSPDDDWMHPLGFHDWAAVSFLAWATAIAIGVLFAAFTIRGFPAVRATWREPSLLKLVSLWAAVAAAVVEEALFRQFLMDRLAEGGVSVLLQVLVSGLLFGLAHAVWGLIKLDIWVAFSSMIATTLMGTFLAIVYLFAGRNLAPCIVAHFIITGTIEPGLIISAVTGQWDRSALRAKRTGDSAA